jgi:hypothetical protein
MNWATARKNTLERDGYRCWRCFGDATDVHHRLRKGMGGTANEKIKFGSANLISLCRYCHSLIHGNPTHSYAHGWLVHSWHDPEDIPVSLHTGTLMLKTDGTIVFTGECEKPPYLCS